MATPTGRFSSKEPNIQNIPIRTEEGRLIRESFVDEYFALADADTGKMSPRKPIFGYDPCDEMVTDAQIAAFFADKMRPGWPHVDKLYERAAAIMGTTRNEAKRRMYAAAYGG